LLVNKIMNSNFNRYYYGYFSEPFKGKQFDRLDDKLSTSYDYKFDTVLNEAIIITYQLNYITQVYNLYYEEKKIAFTTKPKKELRYIVVQDASTGDEKQWDDIAPFNNISDIDVRSIFSLKVNELNLEDKQEELKEILKQKLKEIRERFVNVVDFIAKIDFRYPCLFDLDNIHNVFIRAIKIFQEIISALWFSQPDPQRSVSYYAIITGKKKNPIKICEEYRIFSIPQQMLDNINQVLIDLNNISTDINIKYPDPIDRQDKAKEIDSIEDDSSYLIPDEESIEQQNEMLVMDSNIDIWHEVNPNKDPIDRQHKTVEKDSSEGNSYNIWPDVESIGQQNKNRAKTSLNIVITDSDGKQRIPHQVFRTYKNE
jgi:hypothetical protein